jgi:hypothetical protein
MSDLPVFDMQELTVAIDGKNLVLFATHHQVWRAKVSAGWLVFAGTATSTNGVTFYPDPEHQWDGGTEP